MKIIVVSGGFDPIHSGHIEFRYGKKRLSKKTLGKNMELFRPRLLFLDES